MIRGYCKIYVQYDIVYLQTAIQYLYEYLYVPILPTSFTIPSPCLQAFTQLYYLAVKLCVEAACYCHRPNPPPLTYLRITKIHAFFHLRSWLFRDFRGFCEILLSFWLLAISAIARKQRECPSLETQLSNTQYLGQYGTVKVQFVLLRRKWRATRLGDYKTRPCPNSAVSMEASTTIR